MSPTNRANVMVSHSSVDKDAARLISVLLAAEGVDVWFDEWEIALGDSIPGRIETGLTAATHVVLVCSGAAAASQWVTAERHAAVRRAIETGEPRVIVVRVDDTPPPPLLDYNRYHVWHGGTAADREALIRGVIDRDSGQSLVRAVVAKAQELTIDLEALDEDPLPYIACPDCGSGRLVKTTEVLPKDRMVYYVSCKECHWLDWSE